MFCRISIDNLTLITRCSAHQDLEPVLIEYNPRVENFPEEEAGRLKLSREIYYGVDHDDRAVAAIGRRLIAMAIRQFISCVWPPFAQRAQRVRQHYAKAR